MSTRSVAINLLLNPAGFLSGMGAAQKAALGFGVALAATGVAAISAFAGFDEEMSAVQAATRASGAELESLKQAAIDAGASTIFSAEESAAAITELAKAGVSTADILGGGLTGALDLAAAGGLEVADAAQIAASALGQFGLEGEDVSHVADLLAAGAGKAQGSVTDMAAALNQSGLVAAQMGLSIEETTGALAQFASAGLIGSDAGTSFRTMLLRLANPTEEAKTLMDELGLSFYDAEGAFIGVEGVAGQLQTRLGGLTQEQRNATLATLFGADAIRGAAILYEDGAAGVAEWADKVNDTGYAAETAAIQTDNLKGDLERLGGAIDALLIKGGALADDVLRGITAGLTGVIDGLNGMTASDAPGFLTDFAAVGSDVVVILQDLWGSLGPVITGFAALTAGAAIAGLTGIATALSTITGALADNQQLVTALAIGIGVTLAGSFLIAQARALALLYTMSGVSLVQFRGLVASALGLTGALTAAAGAAARLALALGPVAAVAGLVYAGLLIANVGDAADDAREEIENFWRAFEDVEGPTAELAAIAAETDRVKESFAALSTIDQVAAFPEVVKQLEDLRVAETNVNVATSQIAREFGLTRTAATELADSMGLTLSDGLGAVERHLIETYGLTKDTTAAQEAALVATDNLAAGYGDAAENAEDLVTAVDGLTDAFRDSLGLTKDYQQAIDDLAQLTFDQDAAGLGPFADALGQIAVAAGNVAGYIDLGSQAGRDLSDELENVRDAGVAAFSELAADGNVDAAITKYNDTRDAIADAGEAIGLTREQAVAYADALLGTPEEVLTKINLLGAGEAAAGAGAVNDQLGDIPVVTEPKVTLFGSPESVARAVAVDTALGGIPIQTLPRVDTVGTPVAVSNAQSVEEALGGIPIQTSANVGVEGRDAAVAAANAVQAELNSIPSYVRSDIAVVTTYSQVGAPSGGAGFTANRWGGIDAYAAGGIRKLESYAQGGNRVAGPLPRQAIIAAPQRGLIQWAEPATGGEAFIPRNGNAERSLGILAEAAAWYGAQITPAATGMVQGYGRVMPASSRMPAPVVNVSAAPVEVTFIVDGQEFRGMMRTEISRNEAEQNHHVQYGYVS